MYVLPNWPLLTSGPVDRPNASGSRRVVGKDALDVLGQDVELEVNDIPGGDAGEIGGAARVRNNPDGKTLRQNFGIAT